MEEKDYRAISKTARSFMKDRDAGVLSTHFSKNEDSYPLGTVCPFVLTDEGNVIILISDIAIHTKNIMADPKVGFTVFDMTSNNKQASPRVMLIGDASVIKKENKDYERISENYFTFFPQARNYFQAHGFDFWSIKPNHIHFIQGFGKISTYEAKEGWALDLPEWLGEDQFAIDHMNSDHKDTLFKLCEKEWGTMPNEVSLVSVDREGFHLKADENFHYLNFLDDAGDAQGLHREFVKLAKSL